MKPIIKLLLNPAAAAKPCIEPQTDVKFMIRPISPEQHEQIRSASTNEDHTLNIRKWGSNYAVAAIAGWGPQDESDKNQNTVGDANGPVECNEANLRTFGANQAYNIMPWVIERATSLDQFRVAEETAAKND